MMISTALGLAFASCAHAEVLATCGRQDGISYYPERGPVPKGKGGWTPDQITAGRTTLSKQGEEFDVLYADATGAVFSSRAEGATIVAIRQTPDELALIIAYPGNTAEVYQFLRNADNSGELVLTQSKGGPTIAKGAVLVSKCSFTGSIK
ncbi:MAG: hypothetical protein WCL08_05670 [Verrucomicrobiota bacterium]